VTTPEGPTVSRRRLAAELRRLRGNLKGSQVATGLGWSTSKVSRFELGRAAIPLDEAEKLLDFYKVTEPARSQLLSLARGAYERGWWEDYSEMLPEGYEDFIGLEAGAATVSQCQVEAVPGLLQTADYARQVLSGYQSFAPLPPSIIDGRVRVRMIRQQTLTRDPPLQLSVVIDESVLLRRIGSRELMRAQLMHLAKIAELPNVDLRVLPLSHERALVADSFAILGFATTGAVGQLNDIVSIESAVKSESYEEGETNTFLHRLVFKSLLEASLSASDSLLRIAEIVNTSWALSEAVGYSTED
jgi:transcriptional regulator with XRE-family HTH domain